MDLFGLDQREGTLFTGQPSHACWIFRDAQRPKRISPRSGMQTNPSLWYYGQSWAMAAIGIVFVVAPLVYRGRKEKMPRL